ncbi:MAG: hypothetical protein II781_01970, partial [Clostridia bacterium]|nr:hypothetical protein [Clostridia bacterium]
MVYPHTRRPGFLFGMIDFMTFGLFFLIYMPASGFLKELREILGHPIRPYWQAYLLGIPTLFLYPLFWMARISEELKEKAISLGIPGPYTSRWHMILWNTIGVPFLGAGFATKRFFDTLNRVE